MKNINAAENTRLIDRLGGRGAGLHGAQVHAPQAGGAPRAAASLPPVGRCVGREALIEAISGMLLADAPRPVPIVGPDGIGKSTLGRAVLHRPEIEARYGERRWFVRLDGETAADAVVASLAAALGVGDGPGLRARVLDELSRGRGVLVLDGIEGARVGNGAEALLEELAAVQGLALVAAVRGPGLPGGVAWGEPVEPAGLDAGEALALFCAIAGDRHRGEPALAALLAWQEGVPLAVTLLAHAAEGEEIAGVARAWEARQAALIEQAGEASGWGAWAASVELVMGSRRLGEEARRLAAILATLPDGIAAADLGELMPGAGAEAARALVEGGLAFFEAGRLRMLAPVRGYVAAAHGPDADDLARAMAWYGELGRALGRKPGGPGGAYAVARLSAEVGNLEAMIRRGLARWDAPRWIDTAAALSRFARVSSHPSPRKLLSKAAHAARGLRDAGREADCLQGLGDVALARAEHGQAQALFAAALGLHRRVGSVLGEASCLRRLGDVARRRSWFGEARARYTEARALCRRGGDALGEASCVKGIGDMALACSLFEEARARYAEARPLYQQAGSRLGEANCLKGLGDLALRRAQPVAARERYAEAQALYRRAGDALGEANCLKRLGDLAMTRAQPEEARPHYEAALGLYAAIPEPCSIGMTRQRLAWAASDPAERRRHLDAARAAWLSVDRPDLIAQLDAELSPDA